MLSTLITVAVTVAAIVIAISIAIKLGLLPRLSEALGNSTEEKDSGKHVYILEKSLFTPAELRFLRVLEQIETPGLRLGFKLRLADIFKAQKGKGWQAAFNKINRKHVDFILFQESDGKPVLGIELDDSSHDRADRKERDKFVDEVFSGAGLPLIHFPVQKTYDAQEISERMMGAIGIAAEPSVMG